jgi:hypothetical protein
LTTAVRRRRQGYSVLNTIRFLKRRGPSAKVVNAEFTRSALSQMTG